ncbi:hypothetical protein V5N11_020507 [Cardamine amara subsp. amara]|uniref:Uncharacterized protein n=1 Tax=Cardamine amara subsp. amara TaxID=228776 RepID=A0ABD1AT61_CARAN
MERPFTSFSISYTSEECTTKWKRQNPTNTAAEINSLKQELEAAFVQSDPSFTTIKDIKQKLSRAYYLEEVYWKQKSRNQWLLEGDRNTKFFHGCARTRKARNRMVSIKNSNGVEFTRDEDISAVATGYFQDLFQSTSTEDWGDFFDNISSPVT